MTTKHTHRATKTEDRGYTGCVVRDASHSNNPARHDNAHGGIVQVDTCSCGAVRRTEINGRFHNRGEWQTS